MGERLNVDKLGSLLLHLQALDQPAEHPEVVPAGRTKRLLARLVQLDPLALAVLSSLWLHRLSIVEEVKKDGEHRSYTGSSGPLVAGCAKTEPIDASAHLEMNYILRIGVQQQTSLRTPGSWSSSRRLRSQVASPLTSNIATSASLGAL